MAINTTTVKLYNNQQKGTQIGTVYTASDANPILADGLSVGKTYYATITATDTHGETSAESPVYAFRTLPNVSFVGTPSATGTTIFFEVDTATTDVGIARCGVIYSKDFDFSVVRPYYDWTDQSGYQSFIPNLDEGTIYYIAPIVEDEYGRVYINETQKTGITTGVNAPSIMLMNIIANQTTAEGDIYIESSAAITAVSVRLLPTGGGNYIDATGYTTATGLQHWTVSGLAPSTEYTVYASCSNAGGSDTATGTLTTNNVEASVTLEDFSLVVGSKTDSVYVEAVGTGQNIEIDTVGVKFYTVDSHSGTPIADAYGQQGQTSLQTTQSGLPSGEYIYGYAYMDYVIGSDVNTVWSASQSVLTVPTVSFSNVYAVSATSIESSIVPVGSVITTKTLTYSVVGSTTWYTSSLNGNSFRITNLQPDTEYRVRATVGNASGSSNYTETYRTATPTPTVTTVNATDITPSAARVNITITY